MRTRSFLSLLVLSGTLLAVMLLGAFPRPGSSRDAWVAVHRSSGTHGSDLQTRCRRLDPALGVCTFRSVDPIFDGPAESRDSAPSMPPVLLVRTSPSTLPDHRAPYLDRAYLSYFANAPPA